MPYQYRMIQIPPNVSVQGSDQRTAVASYLQQLANEQAREGWEFQRVDAIGVQVNPGCLGGLIGRQSEVTQCYVVRSARKSEGGFASRS
ncbi:MAG: DUF4177 domain-containing protein [Chloroflexota bacterium]